MRWFLALAVAGFMLGTEWIPFVEDAVGAVAWPVLLGMSVLHFL